jgi:putative membrane protein
MGEALVAGAKTERSQVYDGDDGVLRGPGWGYGGFGLIGFVLNLVITLGLIGGMVLLAAWLWRRVASGGQVGATPRRPAGMEASPKEILQTRYAKGEITREQYREMLSDLG